MFLLFLSHFSATEISPYKGVFEWELLKHNTVVVNLDKVVVSQVCPLCVFAAGVVAN